MRRIFSIFVALLFVATVAAAQTETPKQTEKPKAKVTTTKTVARQLTGEVTKADASTVSIKPTKGAEESFAINADTKIMQGTKAMTAGDLKTGEKITVHYTKTGNMMTATKIAIPKPKPMATEKPAKTPKTPKTEKK